MEGLDQDGASTERSIDEWLSRREKKLAALTSGRYLMWDTAPNDDLKRLEFFDKYLIHEDGICFNYLDFDVDKWSLFLLAAYVTHCIICSI